jgi:hypothetical protein
MAKHSKPHDRIQALLDSLEKKAQSDIALADAPARLDALKATYSQAIAVREEMRQVLRRSVKKSVVGLSLASTAAVTAVACGATFLLFPMVVPVAVVGAFAAPVSGFLSASMIGDVRLNAARRKYKDHYERFARIFQTVERQTVEDLKTCHPEIVSPLECYAQIKTHIKSGDLSWQFARALDKAHQELLKQSGEKSFKVATANRHNYWS